MFQSKSHAVPYEAKPKQIKLSQGDLHFPPASLTPQLFIFSFPPTDSVAISAPLSIHYSRTARPNTQPKVPYNLQLQDRQA